MPAEAPSYALLALLAIALVTAAITDLSSRRIANRLTGAIALSAPLFWASWGMSVWPEAVTQIALALAVFACLAGLFAMNAMGGGDVKLLSALALWIEPSLFLKLVLATSLAGGVLTVGYLARHRLTRCEQRVAVPYGVAIAFAGLWIIGGDYLRIGAPV